MTSDSQSPAGENAEREDTSAPANDPARLVYNSAEILCGRREVWIEHQGEMYRLRVTAAGRLYLTK